MISNILQGVSGGTYGPTSVDPQKSFAGSIVNVAVSRDSIFLTLANGTTWTAGGDPRITLHSSSDFHEVLMKKALMGLRCSRWISLA